LESEKKRRRPLFGRIFSEEEGGEMTGGKRKKDSSFTSNHSVCREGKEKNEGDRYAQVVLIVPEEKERGEEEGRDC